jgi:hypothetical protein
MPFGSEDLDAVYEGFVKTAIEEDCRLQCVRGDDMWGSNVVIQDVVSAIASSAVVIAELTEQNFNVGYEVGIAHERRKPVLLLAQSIDDVPFDLRHRRVLRYDYTPRGCSLLRKRVAEHVKQMLAESSSDNHG